MSHCDRLVKKLIAFQTRPYAAEILGGVKLAATDPFTIDQKGVPMLRSVLLTLAVLCVFQFSAGVPAVAQNWAHWRGPTGNGSASTGHPPTTWSPEKNIKWKVPLPGLGSGSPVIWNDRVFVVTAVAGSGDRNQARSQTQLQFKVLCFDRSTGKELWQQTATTATPHQETHSTNGYASASPCTDGQHVYAHFGSRGLYCYTMDGQLKWKRNDFGQMITRRGFGEGSSPTLVGKMILVPWDHEGDSALYALDKATGQTIWKTPRDEPSCWATPLVFEHAGKQQVVMNGQNYARSYDLETGKELWRCSGQTERPVASAVAGDGLVYVTSGYRGAFLGAFRPDGAGDIEGSKQVAWTIHQDAPDIASPLLSGGRIYFHKGKSGLLSCVDAKTGEFHYQTQRLPNISNTYASPMSVAGHVYLTGRSGTTVVIKESDQLQIVAVNSVGETVDATPAPAGNELFIRGQEHLFCIAQ
ncbi:PQQ-binding-like beta-propeller repeat protein [Stieleria sp. TO1_6]|uniref:outer membrane protein assembly factor BamB family protein n=1 Tax=Stieleria tagensis TaxID=2956795 RepID=UPI00209B0EAC|nr:PQQ-binding-like beta-propeller repeat protein [Stieleria tagensis]MCO8125569.1 PQQ-binding-like beta-propeller repeat protein [Stieleria tagensis]